MEHELALYAHSLVGKGNNEDDSIDNHAMPYDRDDESDIVSIEDRMTSFDGSAIRESLTFMSNSLKELTRGPRRSPMKKKKTRNNTNGVDKVTTGTLASEKDRLLDKT